MSETLSEVGQQARSRDWERFICALFAPAERRQAVFAILAFNAELARTRSVVTEPILGEMRLQWWRDALDRVFDDAANVPVGNPLLAGMAAAIHQYDLPRPVILGIIDAREKDLEDAPHEDLEALLAYAGATSGGVTELTLHALGAYEGASAEAQDVIRRTGAQLGAAWALIGLIRASDALAGEGRTFVPRRQLEQAGLSPESVIAGEFTESLGNALQLISGIASQYILDCQGLRGQLPKAAIPAFLPAGMAWRYLQRLRRVHYNPAGGVLEGSRWVSQLGVLWGAVTGRF
ncbi:MAG: squalene/phytoene synthase family protein [Rhodospirillaceae bacterium]|nr:squalene/phytoene synthase family protein [Rhodospirillaceae bacterium]